MEFQVGEKVIYPNHGIGVVESIQTRPIPGGKISLYQLRILANDSRVWVPQQNADGVGLRPVIRPAEVRKIFSLLGDGKVDQVANWKGRFKENSDKMRTGSLFEVAVVLKGLTYLSRRKALSFREKRMLERAKFLLVSEIAEVEASPLHGREGGPRSGPHLQPRRQGRQEAGAEARRRRPPRLRRLDTPDPQASRGSFRPGPPHAGRDGSSNGSLTSADRRTRLSFVVTPWRGALSDERRVP